MMRLPGVCKDCRKVLWWNGSSWRMPSGIRHRCPKRCGAWMPLADDRCGRKPRHGGYHRSRYAMDNELRAKGRAA